MNREQLAHVLRAAARIAEDSDLVVAKLWANREKDREFASALLNASLVDVDVLLERVNLVDKPESARARVRSTIRRCTTDTSELP